MTTKRSIGPNIKRGLRQGGFRIISAALLLAASSTAAIAQNASPEQVAELVNQLQELKKQQAHIDARINQLQSSLEQIGAVPPANSAVAPAQAPQLASTPAQSVAASAKAPSRLQLGGDVRVRYESNFGDADGRNRDRGVVRARLRANYAISDHISAGGQISTGDPDDPNTADITLSNWDDDLAVSLDQLYLRGTFGNLTLVAGKIPQPFRRTDLVWDGDVSPQGASAAYKIAMPGGMALKATGLYFQIDEASRARDSSMIGGQVELATTPGAFHAELAAGFYDYRLHSIAGGDAGDWRSNLLLPDGRYRSDFNLLDIVGSATLPGFGEQWPIQLIGNYAHNYGAAVDDDTAYGIDLLLGRAAKLHDLRFGYGYSRTEVDAVLAAFSHDNIDIATNYMLHSLSVDYVPRTNMLLNLTWYHYRPLNPLYAGSNTATDWLDRVRLNFSVNF